MNAGERSDARDRLLAVLLDDPARAVGATVELEAHLAQLDRLSAAVRHEREMLGSVLRRLADAGLRPDQLARLADLPADDVRELLAPSAGQTDQAQSTTWIKRQHEGQGQARLVDQRRQAEIHEGQI